jgi:hypothetical protein
MGIIAIACYKPKKEKSDDLRNLVNKHYPLLLSKAMVTEREPFIMKSEDGTIIEIFEWKSKKAKKAAHSDEDIIEIWDHLESVSENIPLSELKEANDAFANFKPM